MRISISAPVDVHALARFSGVATDGIAGGLGSTATTPVIIEYLKRNHDVTVYTLSNDLPAEETYVWGNLKIHVGPTRRRLLARNYYRPELEFLMRAIQLDDPPFVHAHWTYEFALAPLRLKRKTLVTIHDLPWNVLRYFRDAHRAVRLLMAYETALKGHHFTAVSAEAADHFRRYLNPSKQIQVIPNGISDQLFEKRAASRNGRTNFVFATILQGWSAQKNATAALKAFGIVRRSIPNAQLLMFGIDYEEGGQAQKWAKMQGLDMGVAFVGAVSYGELLELVNENVDAVVHPSLNESFSMTALESLALRKPFIGGKATCNMSTILEQGRSGILVDATDPSAIAKAMISIATDPELRQELISRGFKSASDRYRLSRVASQYEDAYRSLMLQ